MRKELHDIQDIREIIDSQKLLKYRPAFDLNTSRIHFYCHQEDIAANMEYFLPNLEEIVNMWNFSQFELLDIIENLKKDDVYTDA